MHIGIFHCYTPQESVGVDLSERGVGIMSPPVRPVFRLIYPPQHLLGRLGDQRNKGRFYDKPVLSMPSAPQSVHPLQIPGHADQIPFSLRRFQPSKMKLPESQHLFYNAKHRLHGRFSFGIDGLALGACPARSRGIIDGPWSSRHPHSVDRAQASRIVHPRAGCAALDGQRYTCLQQAGGTIPAPSQ